MKKLILKRILHRQRWRYAMYFDYDPELSKIAGGIENAHFSNTHKCWYADASEDVLRSILQTFRSRADIDISAISFKNPAPEDVESGQQVIESDSEKQTQPPPTEVTSKTDTAIHKSFYDPVEFRFAEDSGRFIIRFTGRYDKAWIDEIRSYGRYYYDKVHKEFLLQYSKITIDSLSDYFSFQGVPVRAIRSAIDTDTRELRKAFGDEVRSKQMTPDGIKAVELLRRYLEENRYSARTLETYLTLLELFFKFFNHKNPDLITQNEVSCFMNDFIIKNGFSASYQNQIVSAIKLYYEISGKGKIIPHFLDRPRRSRALPKVFSKEEVTRILNSSWNIKHKLLLWIIYSCGLRRSEVTNLKLEDLDRKRNIIHIREGKGRVDRIVPVPDKLWPKIDEYVEQYSPVIYLFEGQTGGKYSAESVYNVFKKALRKAGIRKEVGVHSLRHSYATHLHEKGLDIRFIQELLGHKSTRTTEIYTHVSRRNLAAVKSPLDDLDLK